MTTGELIKAARKKAGLTQVELGKKLGVSGSMIGQWENDLRKPKSDTIRKISEALGDAFNEYFFQYMDESDKRIQARLQAIKEEEEARGKEIHKKAEKAFQKDIERFINSPDGRSIIGTFYELNEYGQKEAMERMIELTFLPQFSREKVPGEFEEYVKYYIRDRYHAKNPPPEPQETALEGEEYTDTTKQEKPPEGKIKPNDGK